MVDATATLNSFITITSTAASSANFVITGTDVYGNEQTETIPVIQEVHIQKH